MIYEIPEGVLKADGFDEAVLGLTQHPESEMPILVYDVEKCIEILIERDGMDRETAVEYFEGKTRPDFVGPQTPLWVDKLAPGVEL